MEIPSKRKPQHSKGGCEQRERAAAELVMICQPLAKEGPSPNLSRLPALSSETAQLKWARDWNPHLTHSLVTESFSKAVCHMLA